MITQLHINYANSLCLLVSKSESRRWYFKTAKRFTERKNTTTHKFSLLRKDCKQNQ